MPGIKKWYRHCHSLKRLRNQRCRPLHLGHAQSPHTTWSTRPKISWEVPLFTVIQTWKQPKCPSAGEQINRQWNVQLGNDKEQTVLLDEVCWLIDMCNNMDQPQKYHAKRKKRDAKSHIFYYIYVKFLERQSSRDKMQIRLLRVWG